MYYRCIQFWFCYNSKNSINFSSTFQDGATPLFLAAQEGHVTVIRQLLTSGAKVNQAREVNDADLTFL